MTSVGSARAGGECCVPKTVGAAMSISEAFAKIIIAIFAIGIGTVAFLFIGVVSLKAGIDHLDRWFATKAGVREMSLQRTSSVDLHE
jgi:hypothetical protein